MAVATESEQLCIDCQKEVKEGSKALCCEICDKWYHIECQNMPDAIYAFMTENEEGEQLLWNCKYCKRGCVQLHSRIRKFEGRQNVLEEQQNVLANEVTVIKEEMQEERKSSELSSRVADMKAQSVVHELTTN